MGFFTQSLVICFHCRLTFELSPLEDWLYHGHNLFSLTSFNNSRQRRQTWEVLTFSSYLTWDFVVCLNLYGPNRKCTNKHRYKDRE